jgi:Fe-S-cluster-containing dehydrogenase component
MSDYYLLQNAKRCIGCQACQVACKSNKGLGPGPALCQNLSVGPSDRGGIPAIRQVFMPCFHCEDPWCLNVCPTGAVRKRPGDGIVYIEAALCIGCKSCIMACPWGACQWDPASRKAVKCDYCKDRLDKGQKPACVTKCLTQCLEFGTAQALPADRRQRFAQALAVEGYNPQAR